MSKVLEKSIGGFFNSVFGPGTMIPGSPFDPSNNFEVSLGFRNYVEKLEVARKISKHEEEDVVKVEYQEWLRQASHHDTKNEVIANYLCRSLIAFSRGHYFTNLHINAINLTQSDKLYQKRIGYLYISRTMAPGSDLTVLLVNTVQRDLSSFNVLQVSMGLSLIPVIMSTDVVSIISSCIIPCLNHQQAHSVIDKNRRFSDEIAKCASHILLQATTGNLSQHYNVGSIRAPFVQVQMLRAIRNMSTEMWNPPDEIFRALESVLQQPWGGRNLTLYMTLLEAVETVVCLPRKDELVSLSLKIILGFLKSSLIDFKYLGIKALGSIFKTLEDMLTEAHLNAVLECLDTSNQMLQSKTIKLMCSMANKSNYQPICVTLMEFAFKTNNPVTQDLVMNYLSDILKRIDPDIPWCISFLTPLVSSSDPKPNILQAIEICVCKGMKRHKTEEEVERIIFSCKKLFDSLLKENVCESKLRTVAYILNLFLEFEPKTVNITFVNSFIDKIVEHIEDFNSECDVILQCLFNFAVILPECLDRGKLVLQMFLDKKGIKLNVKVREKLLLLKEISLTKKVYERKKSIESGSHKMDITLSFCDEWVVKSLEKGATVYKPFTVKSRNIVKTLDNKLLNPFNASQSPCIDNDSFTTMNDFIKSSDSGSGIITGTPPKDLSLWTVKGRIKSLTNDSEGDEESGAVEIAHEAEESFLLEEDNEPKRSPASSFLESHKLDLTQTLLKGLGFSK
ncbi:AP-4 complex subunit epsilon-1 [Armadillidium vulgare]|nr:AP-4 complex subunit epsilon-1 [Armadillidium vulgare]